MDDALQYNFNGVYLAACLSKVMNQLALIL